MGIKLNNLLSEIISGDWGDEDIDGKGAVNVIKTTNFRNDGSISFDNIEKRVIRKKTKDESGNSIWVIDEDRIENKKLQDKDIIIEKSGGGVGTPVGRVVFFENPDANTYICNNFTQVLRVDEDKVYPKYLFYYLRYLYSKGTVLKYQNQTTGLFNLKLSRYLNEEVDLPPFDVQYSLVTQLDVIQNLIDKRNETLNILNEFLRSAFLDMFGDPVLNNKRLKTISLSNPIFSISSGITPSRSESKYFGGNILWVKSTDIKGNIIIETEEKLTQKAIDEAGAKIYSKGSILIAMYGQGKTRGRVALLGEDAACNQACAVVTTKKISKIFLLSYFKYSYDYLRSLSKGGNRDNLSLAILKKIKIIIPDKKDEKKYEEIYKIVAESKIGLEQSLDYLNILFRSVLQNTFKKDSDIDEEPIFKELIKKLGLDDLRGNKKRLQYLINLFQQNKFEDEASYSDAKEKLFELILEDEIQQIFENEKIILDVR